jgi:hypothetical protein
VSPRIVFVFLVSLTLGMLVSPKGLKMDPGKVSAVEQ